MNLKTRIEKLQTEWDEDVRWVGVERPYSALDVIRLRGSVDIEHSLAKLGAPIVYRCGMKVRKFSVQSPNEV